MKPRMPRHSLVEMDSPEMSQRSPAFSATHFSELQKVVTPDLNGNPVEGGRIGSPELRTIDNPVELPQPAEVSEESIDRDRERQRERIWGKGTTPR